MRKAFFLQVAILGLTSVISSSTATAHEMFLKAEDYYVEPAKTLVLKLLNGTFDESLNAINRERMQVVSLVNNGRTTYPPLSAWYDAENTSFLDIKTTSPGTYVVGVSLRQNIITLSAEDFTTYLRHDGILDTLAEFEASGSKNDVTEHYAKHVRVIFQVGDERTEDFSQALGYPVEILLQDNPYDLTLGESLNFQVIFEGRAAGHQLVYAGYQGFQRDGVDDGHAVSLRTDENGRASFVPEAKGIWYISLIHMKKIEDPDADYRSDWATVTFEIR